jgi:hypothetical protein
LTEEEKSSLGDVKVYEKRKDGSTFEYEEKALPTELSKKFSFEIQKATVNKKSLNLNFADLYIERWVAGAWFTASIVVDSSKGPPVTKKPEEVNTYNGMYFYEIRGRTFSGKINGVIREVVKPSPGKT